MKHRTFNTQFDKDEDADSHDVQGSDQISKNSSLNIGKEKILDKGLIINHDFGTLTKRGTSSELTTNENNETNFSCVNDESTQICNSSTTNISKETADKVFIDSHDADILPLQGISLQLTNEETPENHSSSCVEASSEISKIYCPAIDEDETSHKALDKKHDSDTSNSCEIYQKDSDDDIVIVSSDNDVSSRQSSDKTDELPFSANRNIETDVELSELQKIEDSRNAPNKDNAVTALTELSAETISIDNEQIDSIHNTSAPINDEKGRNKSENEDQETSKRNYKDAATLTELNSDPITKENEKDDKIWNTLTETNEEDGTEMDVDEVQESATTRTSNDNEVTGNTVTKTNFVEDKCKQTTVVAKNVKEPTQIKQGNPDLDGNNLKRKHDAVEMGKLPNNNTNNNKMAKKDDIVVISSDEEGSMELVKKEGQTFKATIRGAIKLVKLERLTKPEFRADILKPGKNSVELNLNNTAKIKASNPKPMSRNKEIQIKIEEKEFENKRWFERYKIFCEKMQHLNKFPATALTKSEMKSKIKMGKYIANFEKRNKGKKIIWDADISSRHCDNKNENEAKKDNSSAFTEKSRSPNNINYKPDNKPTNKSSNSAKPLSSKYVNNTAIVESGPVICSQPKMKCQKNPVVKTQNLQLVQSDFQRLMSTTPQHSYNPQRQYNMNNSITFYDFIMTKSSRNMNTNSSFQSNDFSEWNNWSSSPSMTQMSENQNSRSNTINQTNKSTNEFNYLSNTKPPSNQDKRMYSSVIDSESSASKSSMGKLHRDITTHTITKAKIILPSTTTTSKSMPTQNTAYQNQNKTDSSSSMKIKMAFIDRTNHGGKINEEKWSKIEEELLKDLIREINNPYMKDIFTAFNGFQWEMGIKVIECNNEKAVQFLENSIRNMRPLSENIECVPSSHVLKRTIVCLTIPPPKLGNDTMLKLLKQQNKDLLSNSWKIVHSHPKGNCIEIKVDISVASADLIKKSSNPRIRFGMNQLSVTFTTNK